MAIKCYLCNGTESSGCNCHEGIEAIIAMDKDDDNPRKRIIANAREDSQYPFTGFIGE